ncbi:methyl-accepting chemotaxis protein [Dactylosporangium sp. NPDC005555]|uniref:methyl-accepting chemotaxis protein n=1 Tax=Dactylosporangium sp. NPDC005555 TaxID=3154889 RepID=UPI0033A5B2CF
MSRLGISQKLFIGFLLVAIVTVVVGVYGMTRLQVLHQRTNDVYATASAPGYQAQKMQNHWTETQLLMYAAATAPPANQDQIIDGYIKPIDAAFDKAYMDYLASRHTAEGKTVADELVRQIAAVRKIRDEQILPATRTGNTAAAMGALFNPEMGKILEAQQNAGSKIADIEQANAKKIADDAGDTYDAARTSLIVMLILGVLLSLALATLVARSIVRSVRNAKTVLDEVAAGDLTARMSVTSGDEVGQMGLALNESLDRIAEMVRLVGTSATSLASSSTRLTGVARTIASGVDDAAEQATAVSGSAGEVSRNVQTVAVGTDEMNESIREIAQNATEAVRVANEAMDAANETTRTMAKLGESSAEIGNVIKVITGIAAQTNLLALNATIEAARAGEAGKGFAVVANEVKDLAQETAKATEDISQRISAIQADAASAVAAISRISEVIESVNGYQTTIASAVEEQTATTNEMGRNAANAASGSTEIAASIDRVARAAQSTSVGVQETESAAAELAGMSQELSRVVSRFRA